MEASRAEVCAAAIADAFKDDGEIFASPMGMLPMLGVRLAKLTSNPAFDDELFGPVASIIRVDSIEEAITAANRSRYGLAASVWTRDIARAQEIAEQLDVGSAFINMLPKTDVHLPFGGTKQSGYGKELGTQGIREFANSKVIVAPDNSRNR